MTEPSEPAGPTVEISVQNLFATPLAVVELPDGEALNRQLREAILAREAAHASVAHSNIGGWQSSWDFESWGGEAGGWVIAAAKSVADRLTCDRAGQPAGVAWRVNSWANVNRSGHANEFHTHPGAVWSGSYYVDDGGIGDDSALGGEFEVQDPRGVAPAMYAPHLAFALPGGLSVGASDLIRPRAGVMLLFPAWLSHGVRAYRGDGTRISIAFNLSL